MKKYFPDPRARVPYLQTNRSDDLGSLWSTKGLDFQSNLGAMRLAQKLETVRTTADDADLGTPTAFQYFDDRWFAICGTRVFKNTSESLVGTFSEDASTGAQTNYDSEYSDLEIFNGRLWSTTATTLYSKASGSGTGDWTSRDTLDSNDVHKLKYFKKLDRLYFADGDVKVSSIDTSDVVANTAGDPYFINLGTTGGTITTMDATSQYLWIGRTAVTNSATGLGITGTIVQWDGISAQATNEYVLPAGGCRAITVLNDIPYAVDSEGRILKYTGYGFEEIARFPLVRTQSLSATVMGSSVGHGVHFNGFKPTKNNTLLVLLNNLTETSTDSIKENMPSGIWEVDLATGNFTHRYSFHLKAWNSSTITDFGQNRIYIGGALTVNTLQSDSSSGRPSLVCGASYYTSATVTTSGIFVDSPADSTSNNEGQKKGYFVTTWFYSDEIVDKWIRLWSTFKRFGTSTDGIVYKYRLVEEDPIEATITWVNTTSFTTTTDITAYGPTATGFDGTTGGEVEGTQGTGSGACVHITNISEAGGTYTVTVDEAVTGVTTGTAKARFQKWIKLNPSVTGQVNSWSQHLIGGSNVRIQIKGVLSFTGDGEFFKLAIFSNEDIKINA